LHRIMSVTLAEIKAPIKKEMEEFEVKFRSFMKSNVGLLDRIMTYIVKRKGKQMRPMFVFLSAGATNGITEQTYRGASLIELLHTATLVHDDVVDDSMYRRGFFSINALWKNKIAVLVGDFLLSRGLLLSVENKDYEILQLVSDAVRQMSEGELLQMEKARNLDITEDVYFEIIRQKTASLISSCCVVGACSSGANGQLLDQMRAFGEKVGIAFQIKDDLFDYSNSEIGKPLGIDIREKKMTLPLIYSLQNASWSQKRHIKYLIKNKSQQHKSVREVIDFVADSGGIEYAKEKMDHYYQESKAIISDIPETPYKEALLKLVDFTIMRKK